MGFFEKSKMELKKTRAAMANTLGGIFASFSGANEEFYEELEESMILADIGVETSCKARRAAPHRREGAQAPHSGRNSRCPEGYPCGHAERRRHEPEARHAPVRRACHRRQRRGKTTTIGKLASRLKKRG